MTPPSNKKATVYVDIDDEITSIIDKVITSRERIVALVLPKRASMLQSIVNMKLLKRSADNAKKKIVLITSDPGVVPLAGIADVHVAKTLQTKPEIPEKPKLFEEDESTIDDEVELDKSLPIATLAGDNVDEEVADIPEEPSEEVKTSKKKVKKDKKKFKVPNFSKFRIKLILAALLIVLLIGGWVSATKVLPKADITIKTDTKSFSKDLKLIASIAAPDGGEVLPAKIEVLEKDDAATVPATGEKNVGKRAEGLMTLTNCIDDDSDHTIPKGTSFSKDGKTFVTTKAVTLKESIYLSGKCATGDFSGYGGNKDVEVEAVEGGTSYNIDAGAYNSSIAGINAYGSKMKGGTDDVKKVVSQADIDKATSQLKEETSEGSVDALKSLLASQGFIPFENTYKADDPKLTISEEVNSEASSVTVAGKSVYRMTGVKKEAISEAIKKAALDDIDDSAQVISDTGIDRATVRLTEKDAENFELDISTLVTAGPQLDAESLKAEILSKRYSETESYLSSKAGVVDVDIEYSPFWVNQTPKNPEKVTITIENISENGQ